MSGYHDRLLKVVSSFSERSTIGSEYFYALIKTLCIVITPIMFGLQSGLHYNSNNYNIYFMDWKERITSDKNILLGKPVIKGTRISLEFIFDRLANGWDEKMILDNYPNLMKEDIQAVFAYLNDFFKDGLMVELRP